MKKDGLIPPHGGYRKLKSYQIAQLVYDMTVRFCDRYVNRRSRTHDQMVQAARSGVQNIVEGSQASGAAGRAIHVGGVEGALSGHDGGQLQHRIQPELRRLSLRRLSDQQ